MRAGAIPAPLFEAARAGDQVAILHVLDVAQPDIRRYARTACGNMADAEDAAQETLWLLFRRIGTVRSLAALSAWLFTVARRECLRLARRAGLVPSLPLDDALVERLAATRPDDEMRLDLAAAIEALPAHYREIVLLRDVREMTIDEIATALGATRQAVKARLHRARILLREFLTEVTP